MHRTLGALIAAATCAAPVCAQPSYKDGELHGRKAYVLENGSIRVSALRGGGHVGEIRFLSGDSRKTINPMYVPPKGTMEPYEYDPAKHRAQFGNAFSAGYMGHMLCFPSFGPASADEVKNGLGGHGEAATVEWKQSRPPRVDTDGVTLFYGADLPKTQYRVERTITLLGDHAVVDVEETFENLASFDRPYNRDGHATFGMPFVDLGKNFFDTSGSRGMIQVRANHSLLGGREFEWPQGVSPNGRPVDLRGLQNVPKTNTLYAVSLPRDRPLHYFTLYNTDYPVLIGFVLPGGDHDWVVDWQNHQGDRFVRGIEFGTSPFDEGLRKSVERGTLFGLPTYRWIGARAKATARYSMFLIEIPLAFRGVQDVRRTGGRIVVVERETGREYGTGR